ncbi:LuxE/PaaK family acyltransferase [Parapedobacter koreensis]|uniref:Acyl-protein synthetase, LuxE n=1 Tax=Parapedobacter koreensis TaxID=332977 RepID=A0A1H7LHB4_9SPHI|nr:acyl transferase [Parapedobacter koreensis]SEK97767.1 Acyl-protein synthetase, LuxE [Parapedobacter koreensis]
MDTAKTLPLDDIFAIGSPRDFEETCLTVFAFQAQHCAVYREYLTLIKQKHEAIHRVEDIPFLPIEFFKQHKIMSIALDPQIVFSSSGTTGSVQSKHYVADVSVYERSFRQAFMQRYGNPRDLAILALLPSYAEREGSSLIYMVDDLIRESKHPLSGYFLYDHEELFHALNELKASGTKTLLIGVTFALLDFVETYQVDFPELIVMETGGMKGRKQEMIREEVHEKLRAGFNIPCVHSEYGMTELLSQAYSTGHGLFSCPPWMNIIIRDTEDPFGTVPAGLTGAINVIDLANVYSCAFIATQDLGKVQPNGNFEVLGRFDNSDIRGCNLLLSE